MKKLVLLIIIALISFCSYAQSNKENYEKFVSTLTEGLIEDTNGYLLEAHSTEAGYVVDIKVSSKFNNESLISTLNPIFKEIGFKTVYPWGKSNEGGIRCIQSLYTTVVMFNYDQKTQVLSYIIPK